MSHSGSVIKLIAAGELFCFEGQTDAPHYSTHSQKRRQKTNRDFGKS